MDLNVQIGLLTSRILESKPAINDVEQQLPVLLKTASQELHQLVEGMRIEKELYQEIANLESVSESDLFESVASLREKYNDAKMQFLVSVDAFATSSKQNEKFLKIIQVRGFI